MVAPSVKVARLLEIQDCELQTHKRNLLLFLFERYQNLIGVQDEHLYKNMQTIMTKLIEDLEELDEWRKHGNSQQSS